MFSLIFFAIIAFILIVGIVVTGMRKKAKGLPPRPNEVDDNRQQLDDNVSSRSGNSFTERPTRAIKDGMVPARHTNPQPGIEDDEAYNNNRPTA